MLEDRDGVPILLDYGEIETQRKCPTSERLWELEQDLVALLREFQPTVIGIEKPVINRQFNHLTGVLEAMGVIHLVCYREMGLVPVHLSPKMWKHNLADGAGIEEITEIIASLFELSPSSRKRLDAIGIAYGAFCGVAME